MKDKSKLALGLSLKYSVLSSQTAFFGKIKNKAKSGKRVELIEIPTKIKVKKSKFINLSLLLFLITYLVTLCLYSSK